MSSAAMRMKSTPPTVAAKLVANDQKVIDSKEGIQFEESVPDASGRIVSYISNKFPLLDAAGDCYAISGIFHRHHASASTTNRPCLKAKRVRPPCSNPRSTASSPWMLTA